MAKSGEEHFPAGCDERINLHLPFARKHRADGPAHRREQEADEPTNCITPSDSRCATFGQNRIAMPTIPIASPIKPASRQAVSAEDEGLQHHEPDRRNRDDQRGESGGHPLFGPGQAAIAADQQQAADCRQPHRLIPGDANVAADDRARRQHQRTGDQESHSAHDEGRNARGRTHADGQIGRSPEDVNQPESNHDFQAMFASVARS